jgi:phosphoribosylaminoimidazole-succinocarboxamide synthase
LWRRGIFPNHYLESVDARTMRVQKAERIDIEWIVRRHLYGSAWRQYQRGERTISGVRFPDGLRLAEELSDPVLTPTTKSATGHDAPITKAQAIDQGLVTKADWTTLEEATLRLFEFYRNTARSQGIIIPDFKLEFGRVTGRLVQIDEPPTHDSARFWSEKHFRVGKRQEGHCLDKEFLRAYLLGVGFNGDSAPPALPPRVVAEVARRCVGAYRVLSGQASLGELELKSMDEVLL